MASVTLKYTPNGGTQQTFTLNLRIESGIVEPDEIGLFPGLGFEHLDGSLSTANVGLRREILIAGVSTDATEQKSIADFMLADVKELDYGTESGIQIVNKNAKGFSFQRLRGLRGVKIYRLELREVAIRTSFP